MAAAPVVQARERHGRMASELLASVVVERARRRAAPHTIPKMSRWIGAYVAAVEAGIGSKRVARSLGARSHHVRQHMRRIEDERDDARFDALVNAATAGALA